MHVLLAQYWDTAVTITSDQLVVGQAGIGCRASLRAAQAHGALRPQPDRLNHTVDRATEVGVLPNCELVPCCARPPSCRLGLG